MERSVERAVQIATLGDIVLDVVLAGDLARSRDAEGIVRLFPGGSAANFAVAAARAGGAVTFFGRVGDDVAGRLLVAELAREGVTPHVRAVPSAPTGTILVLVGADGPGSSRMISEPGASASLAPEDLDPGVLGAADLVHMTGYSWLRPGPAAATREAVRLARPAGESGAIVSLDPGPAHLIAAHGAERFAREIAEAKIDLLLPNRDEGEAMTGQREPRAIVAALRAIVPVVILKLGAEGCLVAWGDRVAPVPAADTVVVDTTGAGDSFAAGFAVAYARARDPLAAARAGAVAAGATVAKLGPR